MNTQTIIRGTGAIAALTSSICLGASEATVQAGSVSGSFAALQYLMGAVYIWGPLMMLLLGCSAWLLALVLLQPKEGLPRAGLRPAQGKLAAGLPQLGLRR